MIRRTMDATFLCQVANLPDVRPTIGVPDAGPIELARFQEVLGDPRNLAYETEGGGWWLQQLEPGTYEIHTLAFPEARGAAFYKATEEMLRAVFTETDAVEIVTKCEAKSGAWHLASRTGFLKRFERDGTVFMDLNLDGWFLRDPEAFEEGRAFHTMLEAAKLAKGSSLPVHPDDEVHDRAVGAAILMAKAGFMAKAVGFYNRQAIFSGHPTITMVGQNLVDIRDAVIEVRSGQMKVLLVR